MKAIDKSLQELMEASAAELQEAEQQLDQNFAKADTADAANLDIDETQAADAESEDDEDEDEGEESEGDEVVEGVFGKALQPTPEGEDPIDAGPILATIAQELTGLRAEVTALRAENQALAKAQGAAIRGTAQLVKAQAAAMGMPVRPKAAVVIPTGTVAKAQPDVTADQLLAKAIDAVSRKELTATQVGVFQQLTETVGLSKALELQPEFQQFAQ